MNPIIFVSNQEQYTNIHTTDLEKTGSNFVLLAIVPIQVPESREISDYDERNNYITKVYPLGTALKWQYVYGTPKDQQENIELTEIRESLKKMKANTDELYDENKHFKEANKDMTNSLKQLNSSNENYQNENKRIREEKRNLQESNQRLEQDISKLRKALGEIKFNEIVSEDEDVN